MRENIFVTWIKAKSKEKGLKILSNTNQVFKADLTHSPKYMQQLVNEIIKLGERDGELGIQALILRLRGAERVNQQAIPIIHSALDTVTSGLGFENRYELISFFDVPLVDRNTPYDPVTDTTFDDRIADVYSAVLKIIQQIRPNIQVTLPRIAELAKTPKKYVAEVILSILERKPALGEFMSLEQVFIRKEDTDEIIDDLISNPIPRYGHFHCPNCQEIIEDRSANTCPSCGEAVLRCIVCKLPISSDDGIGKCSQCEGLAHLSHLQEWVKVNGTCPSCLQKTEVIVEKEVINIAEELPYGIDLSRIQIVKSGEWKDVPETTLIEDIPGFFNMFFATSEKKLLHWTKGGNNYIGFFESGKLFAHFIQAFESVKVYLVAAKLGFKGPSAPEKLKYYLEARGHGWADRTTAVIVWDAINKDYVGIPLHSTHGGGESEYKYNPKILNHPFIQEKYQKVLSLRPERGLSFEMLPPFDSECLFGEDWFIWFLAYHSGWSTFEELSDFANSVFPEITEEYLPWINAGKEMKEQRSKRKPYWYDFELNKKKSALKPAKTAHGPSGKVKNYLDERNDRFLKLVYLAVHGPFKEGDDWLQGWPSYDSLMAFWTNLDELKYYFESRDEFLYPLRKRINAEILPMKAFPAILPYDPSCETALDWIIKAVELENWSAIEIETIKEQKDSFYRKP